MHTVSYQDTIHAEEWVRVQFPHGWFVTDFSKIWHFYSLKYSYGLWDKSRNPCRNHTFPDSVLGWDRKPSIFGLLLSGPSHAICPKMCYFCTDIVFCSVIHLALMVLSLWKGLTLIRVWNSVVLAGLTVHPVSTHSRPFKIKCQGQMLEPPPSLLQKKKMNK